MADIAVSVRTLLEANAALTAIIATRIYPVNRPQDSPLPAVRYTVITDTTGEHLKGSDGLEFARIQFDVFSKRYLEAREVARLMKDALVNPAVSVGIRIGRVRWEGPFDGGEDTAQGYIHRARVDLLLNYMVEA